MTSTKTVNVIQAFDGELIEELPLHSRDDVERMLFTASNTFLNRETWKPAYQRITILEKLIVLMLAEADDLAMTIAREGGKPLADAVVEVDRAINGVKLAIEEIGQLKGEQIPMDLTAGGAGRLAFTKKEPIGVVLAVSAFNHPLNLIVHQVVPAIATGCPVIVKPAANTPLSCLRFVELVHKAGLEKDWCQFCLCDRETAELLISDSRIAFFSFIGSAKVGWELRGKLAPGTRCALEHGGAAPVIVAADAKAEQAIPLLVKGGFYHAGQVCVSVQRVYVDNQIKEAFIEEMIARIGALKVGDPTNPETEVGPLIRPGEVDRVEQWVNDAIEAGAKCVVGGKRLNGHFFAPTILVDPPIDTNVSSMEIFGPVICIYGFDDVSEAIAQANALPFSFQSAVFTQDINVALNAADSLAASAVMINDHTAFRVDWMPFAGYKTSGLGVGGIPHTMADMVQDKMIVVKM